MKTFFGRKFGRYILIHLDKGELILESIEREIDILMIRNAIVISGIGTARKLVYHRIADTQDRPTNEFLTVEGPIEITSFDGMIIAGQPHVHVTCNDLKHAFAGHLEHGSEVQYLADICILEILDLDLGYRNDEFGINHLDVF